MNCPCCGAAELIHDTRHTPYIYKGDATTIPAVKGDFCPACGVVVLNKEQGDPYGEFIRQFQLQVNQREYRFAGTEVKVNHIGNAVLLMPSDQPWGILLTALPLFELGFTLERSQPDEQVREILLP
jgi:YgiT-type zinc finger domain-containing protein